MGPPDWTTGGRVQKPVLHKYETVLRTSCNALHSIEKDVRSPLCKDPPSAMVVVVVVVVFVVRWLLAVGCCCGWLLVTILTLHPVELNPLYLQHPADWINRLGKYLEVVVLLLLLLLLSFVVCAWYGWWW